MAGMSSPVSTVASRACFAPAPETVSSETSRISSARCAGVTRESDGATPCLLSKPARSWVIQFAAAFASTPSAIVRSNRSVQARSATSTPATSGFRLEIRRVAFTTGAGKLGHGRPDLVDPGRRRLERGDVGLREVPVVERLLLRAHRLRGAGVLVPVARLLHDRLAVLDGLGLTSDLEVQRALHRSHGVHVLDLDLGAEPGLTHGTERDVRVAAERPLLHAHVADIERLERRRAAHGGTRPPPRASACRARSRTPPAARRRGCSRSARSRPRGSGPTRCRAWSCRCPPPCGRA